MSRMLGGVLGGLAAGAALSALLVAGERKSGKPSELAVLERSAARRLNLPVPRPGALPGLGEQAVVQGGHLALSALAGATYAAATDEETGVLSGGLGFGLAFYAAMHWLAGPVLGVKPAEWRAGPSTIAMHTLNHLLFGLAVAAGAKAGGKTGA